MDYVNIDKAMPYAVCFFLSMWGSVVGYLMNIKRTKSKFYFADLFIAGSSGGFVGIIMGLILTYFNTPPELAFGVAGSAGWMGAEYIRVSFRKILDDKLERILGEREQDKS